MNLFRSSNHSSISRSGFYILTAAFPLFYVIHGINSNYGLIPVTDLLWLTGKYLLIFWGVGLIFNFLFRDRRAAFILTFLTQCWYFLFGALHDGLTAYAPLRPFSSYSVLLPLMIVSLIGSGWLLYRHKPPVRLFSYLRVLVTVILIWELLLLGYQSTTLSPDPQFGDAGHQLLKNIDVDTPVIKPHIFWIVMDEYASGSTLRKKWNLENPLTDSLKKLGFFVADSATSPYNYTHYSIGAMLDMDYYHQLQDREIVRYQDLIKAGRSIYDNNVYRFLEQQHYEIHHYGLFDVKGYPAPELIKFSQSPSRLIDHATLPKRINDDILWNLMNLFASNKQQADSTDLRNRFQQMADRQKQQIAHYLTVLDKKGSGAAPRFYWLHYMITHEPFLFQADGSLHNQPSYSDPAAYPGSIAFANQVLYKTINRIQEIYRDEPFIIILQSDHGFKFEENDPLFKEESCRILYAVYTSDRNYDQWADRFASVNTFRSVFNKYFNTRLPLLPEQTQVLRYRK